MSAQERITVVGAGVIGLTTALRLLQAGFDVEIVADRRQPSTTGNLAAGLWYPYKVGGTRVARWALESLDRYRNLAKTNRGGIKLIPCTSLLQMHEARPFWADADVDFKELAATRSEERGSTTIRAILPVADPGIFLPWLESQILERGGALRVLDSPVGSLSDVDSQVIVNCTGLGARHLCHDESVVPIRGVVVRVAGTGIEQSVADDTDPDRPAYIIPNHKYCVLGGSAERDRWDVSVSDEEIEDIVERCARLDSRVRNGTMLGGFAGLRPGRPEVRLQLEELERGRVVVHNYGHGGSGFTLAWGCAQEVVETLAQRR